MGYLVSFTVMVRIVIFLSGKCRIVLDRLRASYPLLVLDGTEDSVAGEPQCVKFCSILKVRSGLS